MTSKEFNKLKKRFVLWEKRGIHLFYGKYRVLSVGVLDGEFIELAYSDNPFMHYSKIDINNLEVHKRYRVSL